MLRFVFVAADVIVCVSPAFSEWNKRRDVENNTPI